MTDFSREIEEQILGFCYYASENDMEPDIREKLRKFADAPYTDAQLYDFLVDISKIQCERITNEEGKSVLCIGYISRFVQIVCNLAKYYRRPVDGGMAAPLPEEVKKRWERPDLKRS